MKFLFLALAVLLVLFQTFTVCRGRKSCRTEKGHCRQDCRPGEQRKMPCKNGDYCCIPNEKDSQPLRPTQAPTRKNQTLEYGFQGNFPGVPVIFN